jgi:hypothetical protein
MPLLNPDRRRYTKHGGYQGRPQATPNYNGVGSGDNFGVITKTLPSGNSGNRAKRPGIIAVHDHTSECPEDFTLLSGVKHGPSLGVGGEKRLDCEFRGGNVERRAEGCYSAEKGEFPAFVADTKRHDDVAGSGNLDLGFGRRESPVSAVSATSRRRRPSRWDRHSPRFTIRGAMPSGCRLARRTLAGGASSSSATPSVSRATPALASMRFQPRSTTTAG